MPWTHVETCSRYRPATDFDTDDARAFLERAAAQPAAPETERLREALETLRSAMRTDPADRFWEGWDAALMAFEVAVFPDPLRAAIPAQPAAPETLTWQVVEAAMHDVGEENGCDPACPQLYPSDAPALRRAILARLMKPAPRREPEYHEHVAGDKHSHAFTGPHSHGGVSALAQPAAPETERHEEAGGGS